MTPATDSAGKAYLVVHGNDYTTAHRLSDGKELWRLGDLNPKNRYNNTLRFVASPVATPDLIVVPTAKNGPVVGVKPDAVGKINAGSASEQWRRPRDTPDVPSPLVHDGLVYLCRENGAVIVGTVPFTYSGGGKLSTLAVVGYPAGADKKRIAGVKLAETTLQSASGNASFSMESHPSLSGGTTGEYVEVVVVVKAKGEALCRKMVPYLRNW